MAGNKILLEVVTPHEVFYCDEIEMVIVNGTEGLEGYMADHCPALKLLKEGEIIIQEAADRKKIGFLTSGGYIHVEKNIMIYTEYAEWKPVL